MQSRLRLIYYYTTIKGASRSNSIRFEVQPFGFENIGPSLNQQRFNFSCLLGCMQTNLSTQWGCNIIQKCLYSTYVQYTNAGYIYDINVVND